MENGTTVVDLVTFDDKQIVLPTSFFESKFYKETKFLNSIHYLVFFLLTIPILAYLVFFLHKLKVTDDNKSTYRKIFLGIMGTILLVFLVYFSIVD